MWDLQNSRARRSKRFFFFFYIFTVRLSKISRSRVCKAEKIDGTSERERSN